MTNWEEKYNKQLQINQQLQSDNTNNANNFLNQASAALSCGPDCQKQKISDTLKQQLLNAKSNLTSAPEQLQNAIKKYFVFTKGESGYIDHMKTELDQKVKTITTKIKSNLNNIIQKGKTTISTYDGLLLNFMHIIELYKKYKKENNELEYKLKHQTSDILTNDRKTFYEEQGIDTLKFWYTVIFVLYIICVFVFIISCFMFNSKLNTIAKFVILILLIIYPFISTQMLSYIISMYNQFMNILPSNAYIDI